jgi:capsular exopolysaccharide synthesis family protein
MSRLYEALKEASRFRGNRNDGDARLWEALDLNGMDVPPAHSDILAPQDSPPPRNGHGESNMELASPAIEVDEHEAEGIPGTEAQVHLDQNARLLPHTVNPAVVEYYRRLRTKILQQQEARPFRTLVVTSAGPQEGKTVTVLNLGLSFSTLPSFKVLVIDGDMRRGTLGRLLGVSDGQRGLSNLFDGSARLADVVLKSDQIPVHFMVRGNALVHDLHASHFAEHFQKLSQTFDLILIDSPPVNLLADVQLLAANSDAVLLVARAFSTTRKALEKAAQELAPFRLIGAVLNAGVAQRSGGYYGYY